jgi:hypothetical protein
LVWIGSDARVLIWQANSGVLKKKLNAGTAPITSLVRIVSLDDNNNNNANANAGSSAAFVWSGSWDGSMRIWNTATFKCVRTVRHGSDEQVRAVDAICQVLDHVWSASQDELIAWTVDGERIGAAKLEADANGAVPTAAAMCCTGRHVWCAVGVNILAYDAKPYSGGADAAAVAFRVDKLVIGHVARVLSLVHVPQHAQVWSGDADGTVMVWSTTDFDCLRTLAAAHAGALYSMALVTMRLNDQTTLEVWTAAKDCVVRVWDVESFHCTKELSNGGDVCYTGTAEVGHANVWSVGDTTIAMWDLSRFGSYDMRIVPYENGDKFVGELGDPPNAKKGDEPVRQGRGELHCSDGTRQAGHWHNDRLDGYAIDSGDGERYYGQFRDGRRHGPGVLVYSDGTFFEGIWVRGVRKGNGVLRWANGDELRGMWSDGQVTSGKFEKGNAISVARCARELWRLEMRRVDKAIEDESNAPSSRRTKRPATLPVSKWHDLDALNDTKLREMAASVAQRFASRGARERLNPDTLSIVLCDDKHPLGQIVSNFVFLFKSTYHFSYGGVSQLLEQAVDDLRSFAAQLTAVCGTVFPFVNARLREELVMEILLSRVYASLFDLYKTVNKKRDQLLTVKIDSLSGVTMKEIGVLPLFWLGWQPRQEQRAAAAAASAASTPTRRPTHAPFSPDSATAAASSSTKFYTMTSLSAAPDPGEVVDDVDADVDDGVAPPLDADDNDVPSPYSTMGSPAVVISTPHLGARRRDEAAERLERAQAPYWTAVHELHTIRRYKTIARKLQCLIKVSNSILNAVSEHVDKQRVERLKARVAANNGGAADSNDNNNNNNDDDDDQVVLGAEDKFPILSYVVIRANVPTLYSELQLIRDFAHPTQLREEAGFRLVELEQAVEYVNTLDWNLCDEKGILVPVKVIELRLMDTLTDATAAFSKATTRVPRVLWLAEILLLCGTNRGAAGFAVSAHEYSYVIQGGERDEYVKLGRTVLAVVGVELRVERDELRIEFRNALPLYIYNYLSTVMQRNVK